MIKIIHGECIEAMRGMDAASVDSVVTDPPYHLTSIVKRFGAENAAPAKSNGATGVYARSSAGFMGKKWDGGDIAFRVELWAECLRVLKPGGHLVSFGGTRTYHRMACAIEDAGFEIRDQLSWIYGSGFPKSQNVSKQLDKAAGAEREVVGVRDDFAARANKKPHSGTATRGGFATPREIGQIAPATDLAKQWDGWGTALKPAHEPICLARKPLIGTVAQNVAAHGTGALNIEKCRVETTDRPHGGTASRPTEFGPRGGNMGVGADTRSQTPSAGRWPSNLCHDGSDEVLEAFARFGSEKGQRGHLATRNGDKFRNTFGAFDGTKDADFSPHDSTGTAARFFFSAKASGAERNIGCEEMEEQERPATWGDIGAVDGNPRKRATGHTQRIRNHHPTVKPLALMQWLVRLITPPGGLVLDPFCGSGSTLVAADREQMNAVGIELDQAYVEIARRRCHGDAPLLTEVA